MLSPIELRHELHRIPEIGHRENKTTELLISSITSSAALRQAAIQIHRPTPTGLIVEYSNSEGPYFLFRSDIDALPIQEMNDISWKSTNDCMHACGHDVHMSILYGFIESVMEKRPEVNLLFVFQPAEEGGGGAKLMMESGFFDDYDIRAAFALHVNDGFPIGTIHSLPGPFFASSLEINAEFIGRETHIATPEKGNNALIAAVEWIHKAGTEIVPSYREILCGFGVLHAGRARNIIPGKARIEGTLRSLDLDKSRKMFSELETMGKTIAAAYGTEVRINKGTCYIETVNDADLFREAAEALREDFPVNICAPGMVAEDFGEYASLWPGLMVWLGTDDGTCPVKGLHNAEFLPSDEVIAHGIHYFQALLSSISEGILRIH